MQIELTEQERILVHQGQAVDVIDALTKEAYILLARHRFEQVRSILASSEPPAESLQREIPEGIRISQEAYRRALPELLKQKKLFRHWVAYQRQEHLGVARSGQALRKECYQRGLGPGEFFVGWIDASGLEIEEEVESRVHHYEGHDVEDS